MLWERIIDFRFIKFLKLTYILDILIGCILVIKQKPPQYRPGHALCAPGV